MEAQGFESRSISAECFRLQLALPKKTKTKTHPAVRAARDGAAAGGDDAAGRGGGGEDAARARAAGARREGGAGRDGAEDGGHLKSEEA